VNRMRTRLSVSALLSMALVTGCSQVGGPSATQLPANDEARGSVGSPSRVGSPLDFTVLTSNPTSGWQPSDVDSFEVILSLEGEEVSRVLLPQGEGASSTKARFSNLQVGKTFTIDVWARHGQQIINSQHPTQLTVTFSGEQDVENDLRQNVIIQLDDLDFSGTVSIPLSALSIGSSSRKLQVILETMVQTSPGVWAEQEEVFSQYYERPASGGYRDYRIKNLTLGKHYRVTLRSFNSGGNNNQTLWSKVFSFQDPSQTLYPLAPSDF